MTLYVLKTTAAPLASLEKPLFLASVTRSGRRVEWVADIAFARKFSRVQRNNFERQNSHVAGRWVLFRAQGVK